MRNMSTDSRRTFAKFKSKLLIGFLLGFIIFALVLLHDKYVLENEPILFRRLETEKILNCIPSHEFPENKSQYDPCLIAYVRDNFVIPPPKVPRKITTLAILPKFLLPMQKILKTLVPGGKGFFIDCGAHDGDYNSNTKFIERDFQWTGLLIEPDIRAFTILRLRRRNAYLSRLCLSTAEIAQKLEFYVNKYDPATNSLWDRKEVFGETRLEIVNCVPLYSILKAINVSNIDFFSLDIEGKELEVLKTIPFDKIHIKVLQVEHWFIPEGLQGLKTFMATKNYTHIRDLVSMAHGTRDSVYVRNDLLPLLSDT